jgi:hypothetical protein
MKIAEIKLSLLKLSGTNMLIEHRNALGIDESHAVITISEEWKATKGRDTDTDTYEIRDQIGTMLSRYEIINSTSMYSPFSRSITLTETGPCGEIVRN